MNAFAVFCVVALGIVLGTGDSGTTVILLPDEDGTVGAVSVKTQAGDQTLDLAYRYVTAEAMSAPPSKVREMGEARVNAEFADVLKAQPAKPLSFTLYFVSGTTELTEESKAVIPQIVEAIKGRGPTETGIIGHADRTGSEAINAKVSLDRARAVEKILMDNIPTLDNVDLQFYGDKDPLVPTPPNTPEPKNRRVEIFIL